MPEGPEVRIITEWLQKTCMGAYCLSIFVDINSKYAYKELKGYDSKLFPLYINNITCKGKNIFFHLINEDNPSTVYYLNSTLGLEGHWTLKRKYNQNSGKTHSNLWLNLTYCLNKDECFQLYYDDSRHFGNLRLLNENQYQQKIDKIGPDLLNENVSWDLYYQRMKTIMKRTRTLTVAKFIIKPDYFSGIGNYLKSEILYLARLNPNRNINTLTDEEIFRLYNNSISIIQQSYQLGGLTIKSFVNPLNETSGGYIPLVYDRKIDDYGYKIIKNGGSDRITYWVPQLQT